MPFWPHLADEVEQRFPLGADQAGEELRDPGQPLDGRHADAVLVHGVRQRVLVVEAEQPQHLQTKNKNREQDKILMNE